ncbi:DUF309 domain-containing protein [Haloplanus pelagicus]|jgi:pyruvate/2-oxoglutarate dehydrogenase complex dihydrolipoamide acyltransferase (E2) component|uniref:DUF309 domain-containing protein n=1 Tax=Haloplanus pelagicus TaxID=2949995 RepID=UPI00204266C1|nr:DUF309 domain-containing protein [Haloplanus sp. HW8-1]
MDAALRAGIALYNDGEHRAAHEPWEDVWLGLPDGTDDERFLHGLVQFTATIHHARTRNWSGAAGLAVSAGDYLDGLDSPYRGVAIAPLRRALTTLAADPEAAERRRPPPIRHEGHVLVPADLDFEAVAPAARALASEHGYDEETVDGAVSHACDEIADGDRTLFTGALFEFVAADDETHRDLVARRLGRHVARRDREFDDVAGLFD